jgi:hypothetical protein
MKDLLNEEISRVQKLMYGSINELKLPAFLKTFSKFGDEVSMALEPIKSMRSLKPVAKGATPVKLGDELDDLLQQYKNTTSKADANKITGAIIVRIDDDIRLINNEIKSWRGKKGGKQKIKELEASRGELNRAKTEVNKLRGTLGGVSAASRINATNVLGTIAALVAAGWGLTKIWDIIKGVAGLPPNVTCLVEKASDPTTRRIYGITEKPSGNETVNFFIKNTLNPSIKTMYPNGIILQLGKNNQKAFEIKEGTSQPIGTWTTGSNCEIFLVIGESKFNIFGKSTSVQPSPAPSPTPPPRPRPGQGTYTICTGTYNKGCKSPKIAQLQGCLGITPDGKWGPQTERAVRERTDRTQLIDQDIDQICGRTQPAPAPAPAPEQPTDFPLEFQ